MISKKHFTLLVLFYLVANLSFGQKEAKTYYDVEENQVKEVFEVKGDGIRNGEYIKYHFDGGIIVQGSYKKGQKTGTWNYYHSNGVRSWE
jgi:antitoxin component YwqK of YwqJK toxin-antitoxin module